MLVEVRINPSRKSAAVPKTGKPKQMFLGTHVVGRSWKVYDVEKKFMDDPGAQHWFQFREPGSGPAKKKVTKKKTTKKKASKKKASRKKTA